MRARRRAGGFTSRSSIAVDSARVAWLMVVGCEGTLRMIVPVELKPLEPLIVRLPDSNGNGVGGGGGGGVKTIMGAPSRTGRPVITGVGALGMFGLPTN